MPFNDSRLIKEVESVKKLGFNSRIICWNRDEGNSDAPFKSANLIKLILRAPYGPSYILLLPIWWTFIFINIIRSKSDVIHAFNCDSIVPSVLAGKFKGIPIIYEIEDTKIDAFSIPFFIRNILLAADKLFIYLSNAIVLVDENQINEFSGIPNDNVYIIYDSAIDVFDETNLELKNKKDQLAITYIGVLNKRRNLNLDKLCRAIVDLPDVRLSIAGYGDLVDDIKIWADQSKAITFLGKIDYIDALNLSAKSDILVVLRDNKIMINKYICGSKIWEAMMCGKPILANKGTSTAKKVLEENCGILVDAENIEDIKKAIINLRDNPELRKELGANGRNAYEKRYNWAIMEQRLLTIYVKLA